MLCTPVRFAYIKDVTKVQCKDGTNVTLALPQVHSRMGLPNEVVGRCSEAVGVYVTW